MSVLICGKSNINEFIHDRLLQFNLADEDNLTTLKNKNNNNFTILRLLLFRRGGVGCLKVVMANPFFMMDLRYNKEKVFHPVQSWTILILSHIGLKLYAQATAYY